jgi:phasin family protein
MSEETKIEKLDSAEKAFAEASVAATAKPAVVEPVAVAPVVASPVVAEPAVVIPALKPETAKKAPAKKAPAKVAAPKPAPVAKPAPIAKAAPAVKKPVIKKAAPKAAKKPAPKMAKPAAKPLAAVKPIVKEKIMPKTTKTTDFTAKIKGAFADVKGKAKTAYAKGTAVVGEATEFTKGNVEAVVASGKIVTEGLKTFGTDYVAESKKAYATVTADAKALAAVKSPTEFFELQTSLLKRNFESVFALTSKNTEAAVKLAGDAFAPISSRVALAVEKVKKAA